MTLFSEQHISFQKKVHEECPAYGKASLVFAPMVSELINANKVQTLLDYGSGLGEVPKNLELDHQIDVRLYDPAIEQYEIEPTPAEMVICLDVLDTVEPECVDDVLDHLQALTSRLAFISINTMPQENSPKDERYAATFKPLEWWLPKLMERFELHYLSRINSGFVVVVKALKGAAH